MVTRIHHAACAALAIFSLAESAGAQETATPDEPTPQPAAEAGPAPAEAPATEAPSLATPKVHHSPPSVTTAHQPLIVRADIEHPHLVKRALLVFRTAADAKLREVELLRASSGPYQAEVPAEDVTWPSLSYAIELELLDGKRIAAFASRAEPFTVQVPEDLMDVRERALDQRLGGRRSVFAATGEYVDFGRSKVENVPGIDSVRDRYYRIEGSYTYRPLRVVTEFSIRLGLVRGTAPVPQRELVPGQSESERFDVGLNYGAPTVRFRLHDRVHVEGELLSSITETGFSVGGGGALLLGDPYGNKLTFGFESIQNFGSRFYARMDVMATDHVILGPVIEVTDMPSAEEYGVRLLGELAFDMGGGFATALRGGYQARVATSGGASGGATLSYAF
jgi:hypothetical protein